MKSVIVGGSSPLTRGKQRVVAIFGNVKGLIPAHAGKTLRSSAVVSRPWAHPRSRGENSWPIGSTKTWAGSSPLTRGKLSTTTRGQLTTGLIPAHAGKTTWSPSSSLPGRAHPRSRGENGQASAAYFAAQGSSPLTRGKPQRRFRRTRPLGLIPAHAGKTPVCSPRRSPARAHPRSRGENWLCRACSASSTGSSPLTRGKRAFLAYRSGSEGLIPAHAGKTRRSQRA